MSPRSLLLTLVRHAKSSWRFAGLDDFHRPLNKRGLRDCARMPKLVAACVPPPELLLSSDAVRAAQTCEAMAEAYRLDAGTVRLDHTLYLASAAEIRDALARHAGPAGHVMLVGHNPGLTDLYNQLVDPAVDNLPTLAVAHLEVDAEGWSRLEPGCARVERMLVPKELLSDK